MEITQPVIKKMFNENIEYLRSIRDGQTESSRHTAFHKDAGSRQALLYIQINQPFTDAQVNWTLECMTEVWMKTPKERADNLQYVSNVLMPECLIKFYSDFYKISKVEAEKRIKETPLDEDEDDDSGNESKSTSGGRGQRGTGRGRVRGGGGVQGGARGRARGGARGRARGGAKSGARVRAQPKLSAEQLGVGSKIEIKKKTIGGLFSKFKVEDCLPSSDDDDEVDDSIPSINESRSGGRGFVVESLLLPSSSVTILLLSSTGIGVDSSIFWSISLQEDEVKLLCWLETRFGVDCSVSATLDILTQKSGWFSFRNFSV